MRKTVKDVGISRGVTPIRVPSILIYTLFATQAGKFAETSISTASVTVGQNGSRVSFEEWETSAGVGDTSTFIVAATSLRDTVSEGMLYSPNVDCVVHTYDREVLRNPRTTPICSLGNEHTIWHRADRMSHQWAKSHLVVCHDECKADT